MPFARKHVVFWGLRIPSTNFCAANQGTVDTFGFVYCNVKVSRGNAHKIATSSANKKRQVWWFWIVVGVSGKSERHSLLSRITLLVIRVSFTVCILEIEQVENQARAMLLHRSFDEKLRMWYAKRRLRHNWENQNHLPPFVCGLCWHAYEVSHAGRTLFTLK